MSIEIRNLNKYYFYRKPNQLQALKNVSLHIADGEFVAIVGKSGAGKSTLLHIIGCIEDFQDGIYLLDDIPVNELSDAKKSLIRNKYMGVVLQDFGLIDGYSVKENVMVPLHFAKGISANKKLEMVQNALKKVGIAELAENRVNKISGGQKQRVAIARAIVNNPKVVLADEPTGALDSQTALEIMDVFKELNNDGITVIIVTHDKDVANRCPRRIEIADGEVIG